MIRPSQPSPFLSASLAALIIFGMAGAVGQYYANHWFGFHATRPQASAQTAIAALWTPLLLALVLLATGRRGMAFCLAAGAALVPVLPLAFVGVVSFTFAGFTDGIPDGWTPLATCSLAFAYAGILAVTIVAVVRSDFTSSTIHASRTFVMGLMLGAVALVATWIYHPSW